MKKLILFVFLLFAVRILSAQDSVYTVTEGTDIVGVWQNMPVMASGWSDAYQFFPDNTFRFNYSQMDCARRTIWLGGNWILRENILTLTVKEKMIIEGGELVPASGSCGSEYELINGTEKIISLDEPEIKVCVIEIKSRKEDNNTAEHIILIINSENFWRFGVNPEDYN